MLDLAACISSRLVKGPVRAQGGTEGGCVSSAVAIGGIAVVYATVPTCMCNLLIPCCWCLCVMGSCHLAYSFLFIVLAASTLSSFQLEIKGKRVFAHLGSILDAYF